MKNELSVYIEWPNGYYVKKGNCILEATKAMMMAQVMGAIECTSTVGNRYEVVAQSTVARIRLPIQPLPGEKLTRYPVVVIRPSIEFEYHPEIGFYKRIWNNGRLAQILRYRYSKPTLYR